MECEWCGEPGTEKDPIVETLITPPVSGWEPATVHVHRSCSIEMALSLVE